MNERSPMSEKSMAKQTTQAAALILVEFIRIDHSIFISINKKKSVDIDTEPDISIYVRIFNKPTIVCRSIILYVTLF